MPHKKRPVPEAGAFNEEMAGGRLRPPAVRSHRGRAAVPGFGQEDKPDDESHRRGHVMLQLPTGVVEKRRSWAEKNPARGGSLRRLW
jgi:hypothetical protein